MADARKHPDLFTAAEAMEYLHMDGPGHEGTLAAFVRGGHVPAHPLNGSNYFWRDELDELAEKMFAIRRHAGEEPIRISTRLCGPAVLYFLYEGELLVYIGQSIDVTAKGRLADHRKTKKFDRVEKRIVGREDVDALERGLIALHKPPLNITYKNLNPDRFMTLLKEKGFCK
jgi:hypothetical protein